MTRGQPLAFYNSNFFTEIIKWFAKRLVFSTKMENPKNLTDAKRRFFNQNGKTEKLNWQCHVADNYYYVITRMFWSFTSPFLFDFCCV